VALGISNKARWIICHTLQQLAGLLQHTLCAVSRHHHDVYMPGDYKGLSCCVVLCRLHTTMQEVAGTCKQTAPY
jgi:L-fucose isomerase-like protein